MGELLTPTHLTIITIVAFLLFGGKKLPELGRGLGDGLRGFKDGIKGLSEELDRDGKAATVVTLRTHQPEYTRPHTNEDEAQCRR